MMTFKSAKVDKYTLVYGVFIFIPILDHIRKHWSIGINIGILEYWNNGILAQIFHYSNILIFQYFLKILEY